MDIWNRASVLGIELITWNECGYLQLQSAKTRDHNTVVLRLWKNTLSVFLTQKYNVYITISSVLGHLLEHLCNAICKMEIYIGADTWLFISCEWDKLIWDRHLGDLKLLETSHHGRKSLQQCMQIEIQSTLCAIQNNSRCRNGGTG